MKQFGKRIVTDQPLLFKMIIYIFLFSGVMTIASGMVKAYIAYQQEVKQIHAHLDYLEKNQLQILANSVWEFNEHAIAIHLNSILQHPAIFYLELNDDQDNTYRAGEKSAHRLTIDKKVPIVLRKNSSPDRRVGSLQVQASTNIIRSYLQEKLPTIFFSDFLVILFICAFTLLIFHLLFNRHLNRIALFTKELDIDSLDNPLILKRKSSSRRADELDRIVSAINDMRHRLQVGIRRQEETEQSLRESKERYRQIFNATSEAIYIHDAATGAIIDINQTMLDMYGYSREEILQLSAADLRADRSDETAIKANQLLEKALKQEVPAFVEWHSRRKNGEEFWTEVTLKGTRIGDQDRILAVERDISERVRLEDKLRQAQKMEAIGTLAGGIAHDFNNILSAILGYTQLAQMDINSNNSERLAGDIDGVYRGAIRASDLVKQILTFSRKTEEERQPLQISLIVKEALKLLRSSIPTTIEIKQNIKARGTVMADPTQIHQVMMNLCTNAYHAMRETGGTLTVSLKEVEIIEDDCFLELELTPGKYLQLEVGDTGCGIEKKTIEKIFDPYFTTKKKGEGTGLGLAVVHGIIKSYGGHIKVYSELGKGTTFHIYLPEVQEEPGEYKPVPKKEPLEGGNERIMIVDDEQAIININKEALTHHGYTVTAFPDGVQALQEFRKHPDRYDLVITDMAMPYMEGTELAQKLMEIRPNIPIILSSGYSEMLNKAKIEAMGIKEFIRKPVVLSNLLRTTRKVLDMKT